MWEETLVFNIQMPQIALVRFQVWDHDPIGRDFIGQRTVAFTSMMPGDKISVVRTPEFAQSKNPLEFDYSFNFVQCKLQQTKTL